MVKQIDCPPPHIPETPDELTFKAGDLIMLKTHYGQEWFRGKLVGGAEGIFPKNFVEVVVCSIAKVHLWDQKLLFQLLLGEPGSREGGNVVLGIVMKWHRK